MDALFTATSATCVTGLVVRDTWTQFTFFGQAVLLLLIQVGGLGLVTLTSFFALAARRRMGFRDLRLLGESVSAEGLSKATEVLKIVIRLAATFEAMGAVLLMFALVPQFGPEGIWVSIFTAISAFCNAGFDLFGRFWGVFLRSTLCEQLLCAGRYHVHDHGGRPGFHALGGAGRVPQSAAALAAGPGGAGIFPHSLGAGALLIGLMEWNNPATMGGLSVPGKIMASLFQSVSTRTAGMNTIDLEACGPVTKLWMSILQFIGAAPGSTGGGVKVTTIAVVILTIRSVAQGRDDCVIHDHHIESKTIYRALTIIMLGAVAALGSAVVVYYNSAEAVTVIDAIFESCSAFGTVGLSVGVTGRLNTGAKLLYMLVMFMGRVGHVSLAISLTAKPDDNKRKVMPVGHINVGLEPKKNVCTACRRSFLVCRSYLEYSSTMFSRTSVALSIRSTVVHSQTPWKLKPPVPRLGQGRPFQLRVAPSVPPRTGSSSGSRPAIRMALRAFSTRWKWGLIFSIMFR